MKYIASYIIQFLLCKDTGDCIWVLHVRRVIVCIFTGQFSAGLTHKNWSPGSSNSQFYWMVAPQKPDSCCCDAEGLMRMTSPANAKGLEINMNIREAYYFTFHISAGYSNGYGQFSNEHFF